GAARASGADHVAIYRGIAQDVPGVRLSSVEKVSPILLSALPTFQRSRVEETIPADDLPHAQRLLAALQKAATHCPRAPREDQRLTPDPVRTPSRTPSPGGTPDPTRTGTPGDVTSSPAATTHSPATTDGPNRPVSKRTTVPSDCAGVQDSERPGSR